MRSLVLAFVLAAVAAFPAAGRAAGVLELEGHALAGRVWDVARAAFLTPEEARRRAVRSRWLLLGETHDNPVHHELQAALLRELAAAGRRPALVMEALEAEGTLARGWDAATYEPLAAIGRAAGWRVRGANLARDRGREVARKGFDALGPGEAGRLRLESAWNAQRDRALRATLVEGHCGKDGPMIDAMLPVQRARDALLADAMLEAGEAGAVATLGRGHARRDLGVPLYLAERAAVGEGLSVAFVEVQPDATVPRDYDEARPGRHDLVWFTPRAARDDPCGTFEAPAGKR